MLSVGDSSGGGNGSGSDTAPDGAVDERHPLNELLGGWYGVIETAAPPVVFVATYLLTGKNLTAAVIVGIAVGIALAILRLIRRERPGRVLGALLIVVIGAIFAARTGNAADYFWPRVLANFASALAFAISIMARWPLLGVIVGPMLGTRMRWRQDPVLMKAYSRATWWWVLLSLVRGAIQVPLILNDQLVALAAVSVLFYVLVVATVAASWWTIKRSIPADHPGIRSPRAPQDA